MQHFTSLDWYDYQSTASLWFPVETRWLQRPDPRLCSTSSSDGSRWRLIPGDRQFGGWLLSSRGATRKCRCSFCLCFENSFQGSAGTLSNHSHRLTLFCVPSRSFLPVLRKTLLCSARRFNASASNNVLLRLPFHLPASKTSLWSQRSFWMELHRLCAYTEYLSALDSKSHNWLIFLYSQTSFCAVLHESQGFGFFFSVFSFLIRMIHGALNPFQHNVHSHASLDAFASSKIGKLFRDLLWTSSTFSCDLSQVLLPVTPNHPSSKHIIVFGWELCGARPLSKFINLIVASGAKCKERS